MYYSATTEPQPHFGEIQRIVCEIMHAHRQTDRQTHRQTDVFSITLRTWFGVESL